MSILIKDIEMPRGDDEGIMLAVYDGKAYQIGTNREHDAAEVTPQLEERMKNGLVTDGNIIHCKECTYGDTCNVARGHGYLVGACAMFEKRKKETNQDAIYDDEIILLAITFEGLYWCPPVDCDKSASCCECWVEWLRKVLGRQ
mgnify:CR=1 FL=1